MANQFFAATILAGRVYVAGLNDHGPWDARLSLQAEAVVSMLVTSARHQRVNTEQELRNVLEESKRSVPSLRVWIDEGLKEAVRRIFKEQEPYPKGEAKRGLGPSGRDNSASRYIR